MKLHFEFFLNSDISTTSATRLDTSDPGSHASGVLNTQTIALRALAMLSIGIPGDLNTISQSLQTCHAS